MPHDNEIEALIDRAAIRGLSDEVIRTEIQARQRRGAARVDQNQGEPSERAQASPEPALQSYIQEDLAEESECPTD